MIKTFVHWLMKTSSIWKTAIAAGLSWEAAQITGTSRPYFAPLAAILCLQVTVEESVWQGYQRVLGIICGVILSDTVARFIGIHGWSIALLVLLGTGVATYLKLGKKAVSQVGVSAMMVLTVGAGHYSYSLDRIGDTLIGAVIAILINMFVFPPDYVPEAKKTLHASTDKLAEQFTAIARWLRNGARVDEGKRLRHDTSGYVDELHTAEARVSKARESLKFSPLIRKRRHSLDECLRNLHHLRQGYAHATGTLRTLLEWSACGTLSEPERTRWSQELDRVATVIRRWPNDYVGYHTSGSQENTEMTRETPTTAQVVDDERFHTALFNDIHQLLEDFGGIEVTSGTRVIE